MNTHINPGPFRDVTGTRLEDRHEVRLAVGFKAADYERIKAYAKRHNIPMASAVRQLALSGLRASAVSR